MVRLPYSSTVPSAHTQHFVIDSRLSLPIAPPMDLAPSSRMSFPLMSSSSKVVERCTAAARSAAPGSSMNSLRACNRTAVLASATALRSDLATVMGRIRSAACRAGVRVGAESAASEVASATPAVSPAPAVHGAEACAKVQACCSCAAPGPLIPRVRIASSRGVRSRRLAPRPSPLPVASREYFLWWCFVGPPRRSDLGAAGEHTQGGRLGSGAGAHSSAAAAPPAAAFLRATRPLRPVEE